ncbi:MAG: hypothetical protein K9G33_01485 [Sneathiella sp.]|nr:hypothetical protein [Sneathiella sp.]
MSGIRSPSGIPPGLTGTAKSPSTGHGAVAPATPATPTGSQGGLPANSPQPRVASVPENTLIDAVVTAKSGSDNIILHTEYGNFRLTTPTPLTVGSHIVFEITELSEVILARLITMNGKDFAPPLAVKLLPTVDRVTLGVEGYVKAGQLHPLELKGGLQNLAATQVPSAEPAKDARVPAPPSAKIKTQSNTHPQQSAGAFTAIQGDLVRSNSQSLAAYQRFIAPELSPKSVAAAPRPDTADSPVSRYNIVKAEIIQPKTGVIVETVKNRRPAQTGDIIKLVIRPQVSSAGPRVQSEVFEGTVIALTNPTSGGKAQRVTLQTPLGTISYSASTPPTPGTTVQFAIAKEITAFPLPSADIQQPGARAPLISAMADWQNLRQALNVVAAQDPILAQAIAIHVIPQANSQLSGSLLFFMAALHLGSIEKWLGQEFSHAMKEAGRTPLLQALEDDFATFSRLQADNGGQDWKSLNFPFFDGNNLRQIRMFHRQHKNPDDPENHDETTRFVIELNLSVSGQVQLDGLFKHNLFDLAIRSHEEMPPDMKQHILSLFSEHIEISGLKGQLIFKTISPFPVDPLKEWETAQRMTTSS